MAVKNPRVAITLPEETKRLYERASALMGTSASKYMAAILIEASPAVQELIATVERTELPLDTLVEMTKLVRDTSSGVQEDLIEEIAALKRRK